MWEGKFGISRALVYAFHAQLTSRRVYVRSTALRLDRDVRCSAGGVLELCSGIIRATLRAHPHPLGDPSEDVEEIAKGGAELALQIDLVERCEPRLPFLRSRSTEYLKVC